jgi:hypothetical protein
MPDSWNTFPIEFSEGLITNLSPLQQGINKPGSARVLTNFEPSVEGGYRKIEGYVKHDTAALAGSGIIRGLTFYNGRVYAVRGNELYRSAGSGWTQITNNAAFSSAGVNLGGSDVVRFEKYDFDGNEKLFIVDGGSKPFIFDDNASTLTQLTSLSGDFTGCSFVIQYANHLFLANDQNLFFSAPYKDTDFSVANGGGVINITDRITDLIVFREQLIIFGQTTIKRITGSSVANFQLQPISGDLGAIQPDTAKEVGGDVVFLGPDGIRTLGATDKIGDFNLAVLSKSIQSQVTNFVDSSSAFCSLVIRNKSQYRLFGYASGIQDASSLGVLGSQIGEGQFAWAETRGINARVSYSEYENSEERIYFANDDGYVYRLERGSSFDGNNIIAVFNSPFLTFQDPRLRKTFYKAHLYTDPTGSVEVDFQLVLDFDRFNTGVIQPNVIPLFNNTSNFSRYGSPSATYGTATYGSGNVDNILETQIIGSGYNASITLTSDDVNPPFSLDAVVLEYAVNGRR